uniref:Cysteine-rich membrane protein 2 n=1 Tax=Spironucleus salmonicida TaxID=348837 RepID=V6LTS3_9EUKA|eukprot:EST47648.1 Cysteine-rich membrane protein 2 [Spironucleus salmonicida]
MLCPLFPIGNYVTVNNECVCTIGSEILQKVPLKCATCQKNMVQAITGFNKCTLCSNFDVAISNHSKCVNKCSRDGLLQNNFLKEDNTCEYCSRNMIVNNNKCQCITGFTPDKIGCKKDQRSTHINNSRKTIALWMLGIIISVQILILSYFVTVKLVQMRKVKLQKLSNE